jgi:threonine synthase
LTREDVDRETTAFMQAYGALVLRTTRRGRWALLAHGVHALGWYPVSTYTAAPTGNPYGPDGYKTIAFEIFEELGHVPDAVVVPSSYGEGLAGIWRGFRTLHQIGATERVPRMVAVEPAGGAPLANALDRGLDRVVEVEAPATVATSIGSTVATDVALLALRESGGTAVRISDEDILDAQQRLARSGLFLEPAGAAGMAALPAVLAGTLDLPERAEIVVVGTAGGLRQIRLLREALPEPPVVGPTTVALEKFLASVQESGQ